MLAYLPVEKIDQVQNVLSQAQVKYCAYSPRWFSGFVKAECSFPLFRQMR
jgi:hypothetical protein